MTFWPKKDHFSSQPPKNTIFLGFFEIFCFLIFSDLPFYFFQHKKDKNKSAHFFSRTIFLTTWQIAQKIFSHPYTLFVILSIPKKHYKTGEKQAKKNLGPSFDATLDQVLTQKTPNLGPSFDSTAYMYMPLDRLWGHICGLFGLELLVLWVSALSFGQDLCLGLRPIWLWAGGGWGLWCV